MSHYLYVEVLEHKSIFVVVVVIMLSRLNKCNREAFHMTLQTYFEYIPAFLSCREKSNR